MGRVVVSAFVSIDGVMEAPGGESGYRHSGWVARFPDNGHFSYKLDEVQNHEALLIGRRTYESFAEAWPAREGEFADRMNGMPKFVVSTTTVTADWNNSTVLTGDVAAAVSKLKADLAGDILVVGSRTLVNTLKQHDLVDEYRLMVFPVVLGSGMRLFDDALDATTLDLAETHEYPPGITVLVYRRVRGSGSG